MIWILPWCPKVKLAAKHSHIPMQFANVVQLPYIKKCIDFTKIPAMQQTCFYNDSFFFTEEVTENSTKKIWVNDAATLEKMVTIYFVGRYASFLKEDGNKKTHFSKYVFFRKIKLAFVSSNYVQKLSSSTLLNLGHYTYLSSVNVICFLRIPKLWLLFHKWVWEDWLWKPPTQKIFKIACCCQDTYRFNAS